MRPARLVRKRVSVGVLMTRMLKRATELFAEGLTVREVAATLRISKGEAGRLRLRALADGILSPEDGPEFEQSTNYCRRFLGFKRQEPCTALSHCPACCANLGWDSQQRPRVCSLVFEAARIVASVGAQTTLGSASALRTALTRLAPSALREATPGQILISPRVLTNA